MTDIYSISTAGNDKENQLSLLLPEASSSIVSEEWSLPISFRACNASSDANPTFESTENKVVDQCQHVEVGKAVTQPAVANRAGSIHDQSTEPTEMSSTENSRTVSETVYLHDSPKCVPLHETTSNSTPSNDRSGRQPTAADTRIHLDGLSADFQLFKHNLAAAINRQELLTSECAGGGTGSVPTVAGADERGRLGERSICQTRPMVRQPVQKNPRQQDALPAGPAQTSGGAPRRPSRGRSIEPQRADSRRRSIDRRRVSYSERQSTENKGLMRTTSCDGYQTSQGPSLRGVAAGTGNSRPADSRPPHLPTIPLTHLPIVPLVPTETICDPPMVPVGLQQQVEASNEDRHDPSRFFRGNEGEIDARRKWAGNAPPPAPHLTEPVSPPLHANRRIQSRQGGEKRDALSLEERTLMSIARQQAELAKTRYTLLRGALPAGRG